MLKRFEIEAEYESRIVDGELQRVGVPGSMSFPVPAGENVRLIAELVAFGSIQPYRPDGSVAEQSLYLLPIKAAIAVNAGISIPTRVVTTEFIGPVGFETGNPDTAILLERDFSPEDDEPAWEGVSEGIVTVEFDFEHRFADKDSELYERTRRGVWGLEGEWSGSVAAPKLVGTLIVN